MVSIGSAIEMYSLVTASAITLFLFAIGRFYRIKFERETHYRWFLVPAVMLVVSAVMRALNYDGIILGCAGAILLLVLTVMLYGTMMGVAK